MRSTTPSVGSVQRFVVAKKFSKTMRLFIRWVALTAAVWISTLIIPGIKVSGGVWNYFWVALLLGLVNTFIGSFLKFLTLPAVLVSMGLFIVVINAAMIMLTDRWSNALSVSSFWSALFASIIISFVSTFLGKTAKKVTGN